MTQLSNKHPSIVYANSKYYNSPARIIVLMQEQCNLLIDIARKYLDPASLFQARTQIVPFICDAFEGDTFEFRENIRG